MSTKSKILILLEEKGAMSPKELTFELKVSKQLVHRHLRNLLLEKQIERLGQAPKTFYQLAEKSGILTELILQDDEDDKLQATFIQITEKGKLIRGRVAFEYWCRKRSLPIKKTYFEYLKTLKKYDQYKDEYGLIKGTQKLKNTKEFSEVHLQDLYYMDFYAIERFGKTKLGQLLHYAKQGQNLSLSLEIIELISERFDFLLQHLDIEAIAFVPPTINRNLQIMNVLEKRLNYNLPIVSLEKVKGEIVIPQKALSKLSDRISNAQSSIISTEKNSYSSVLIIDDAVGSGATINESAGKLKHRGISDLLYGLAITGSYKGFEVISEA